MMKKKILLIFFLISFFLLLNKSIYALGLISEANKRISFEPGLTRTYEFLVRYTTRDIQIIIGGYPIEYVTLSRDFIKADDPDKSFYVTINFPETTPRPGHHQIRVQANEVVGEEGAIGTSVNIATHIKIDVLHPGKYAEIKFEEVSVSNTTASFRISANNFGLQEINSFKAVIEIYDPENHKVATVSTNEISIESDERESVTAKLDVNGYDVGDYTANAIVFWDGEKTTVEKVFRVGALKINILDYTKVFTAGTINKFEIILENVWNDEIKDVYVTVGINDELLRSATADIGPFGTNTYFVYWDTTNIKLGDYKVEITAHYLDKTAKALGDVKVIGETVKVKLAKPNLPLVPIILVSLILLILIIDILWFKSRKKKKE